MRPMVKPCATAWWWWHARPDIQLANLMRKMKIEQPAAEAMIKSQMPLEDKIKRADHVVWNNSDRSVLANQAANLVNLWQQEKWTK